MPRIPISRGGLKNMTEQQIIDEILRYLHDDSYNYAVLIDGEWGSGKTYFVNNTLTKIIEKQESDLETSRKVQYISLYGCKAISDVQENIAWSFAEDARKVIQDKNNFGTTGQKVSNNILLSSKKIGNAILKKFLPNMPLYEIASDWLNLGSFIFVFDDLERCDCPINEVFGFLNELVEHENTKVILIANEKELSGIAEIQYLELQYSLTLDDRIIWPTPNTSSSWAVRSSNSTHISLDEMERRRKLLFPTKEANSNYRRIREKLIGVTLKYEPNISLIISEILKSSKYDSSIKDMLEKKKEAFSSEMQNRNHKNIRTFQFFLSKVSYLLEKLSDINTDPEYLDIIKEHIISETFYQAIKFKSNDQPSRTMHAQLKKEQEAKFQSIKQYIEAGTYNQKIFEDNVLNLQKELQAQIPDDDPYYLIYQQYYLQPQDWCEDQLEKVLQRLDENKYPIAFYVKIITSIQRLIDLGFDDEYMNRTKQLMLTNITKMNEVKLIDSDLWYIENKQTKAKVTEVITDINHAIKEHSEIVSRENVGDILKSDNWINRLENYSNPNQNRYVQDMSVFSKAPPEQWLNLLHKASPRDIDDFRHWLGDLYPEDTTRKSYSEDADTIKKILTGLESIEEKDLIKKACVSWLCKQLATIIKFHEPSRKQEYD